MKTNEDNSFRLSEEELRGLDDMLQKDNEGDLEYISWEEVKEKLIAKHNLKLKNDEQ